MNENIPKLKSFKGNIFYIVLVHAYIISRIPFLSLGFGEDPDAWRIANSAFDLRNYGSYHPSRFPGYPLPEFITSFFINYGWVATNTITMLLTLISVIFYSLVIKELNVKQWRLLLLTYIFLPIIWKNSSNTMDYMWALTFIIISWFYVLKRKNFTAGVFMGLALGSRLASAVLLPSFLFLVLMINKKLSAITYFTLSTFLTSLIIYSPLLYEYGLDFLRYYPVYWPMIWHLMHIMYKVMVFTGGPFPSLTLLAVVLLSLKNLARRILNHDWVTIFLLFAIISVLIVFIRDPYEPEYLMPIIPFALILLHNVSKGRCFRVLCIIMLVSSFISVPSVSTMDDENISPFTLLSIQVETETYLTVQAIGNGLVLDSAFKRMEQLNSVNKLMNLKLNHSVIVVGELIPVLEYLVKSSTANTNYIITDRGIWDIEKDIIFRQLISLNELLELKSRGYIIYYISSVREFTEKTYNYDLLIYGCKYLDLDEYTLRSRV